MMAEVVQSQLAPKLPMSGSAARMNGMWNPKYAPAALLRCERFIGHVWDPACGGGNILRAASANGYQFQVVGTDIKQRGERAFWFRGEHDFLNWTGQPLAQNIITNPPFARGVLAEAFIRKALDISVGKVAVFVDQRFLGGAGRAAGLWTDNPPDRIWMITPRPSCPPGAYLEAGNKAGGGTADYVWLVWDMTTPFRGTSWDWLSTTAAGDAQ